MNKKQFTYIINALAKDIKQYDDIDKLFNKNNGLFAIDNKIQNAVICYMEEIFNDDGSWITYWLYELDCGRKYKDGCVTMDNKTVKLKTVSDLWEIIQK